MSHPRDPHQPDPASCKVRLLVAQVVCYICELSLTRGPFNAGSKPKRAGLRDITSTLNINMHTPVRARNSKTPRTIRKEPSTAFGSHSTAKKRKITAHSDKENLFQSSSRPNREIKARPIKDDFFQSSSRTNQEINENEKPRKLALSRPGRQSLGTPHRPDQPNAPPRRCYTARKSKDCLIPGCLKGARSKGLCKRHGGGKRCTHDNCSRSDQGGGFCIAHGGGMD